MKLLYIYFIVLLTIPLNAKILISPIDAMNQNFGSKSKIEKENISLTTAQTKKIEEDTKVKLKDKTLKVFKASQNNKLIGYGILINRKIRSKNAVVLYMISPDAVLKGIEIIAFNEPLEYIPSKAWISQFGNKQSKKLLDLSKDIPNITGATMSAKSFVDGSRVAFAFYNEVLKGR